MATSELNFRCDRLTWIMLRCGYRPKVLITLSPQNSLGPHPLYSFTWDWRNCDTTRVRADLTGCAPSAVSPGFRAKRWPRWLPQRRQRISAFAAVRARASTCRAALVSRTPANPRNHFRNFLICVPQNPLSASRPEDPAKPMAALSPPVLPILRSSEPETARPWTAPRTSAEQAVKLGQAQEGSLSRGAKSSVAASGSRAAQPAQTKRPRSCGGCARNAPEYLHADTSLHLSAH